MNVRRSGLAALLFLTGCGKRDASSSAPAASVDAPDHRTVVDVADVDDFRKVDFETVACVTPTSVACRISRDFAAAPAFTAFPAAKTIYFGRQYELAATGATSEHPFYFELEPGRAAPDGWMRALRPDVPTDSRGGWHAVTPEGDTEKTQYAALLDAVSHGRPAPASPVLEYLKTTQPLGGLHTILKTKGPSLYLSVDGSIRGFFRADGRRVLAMSWERGAYDLVITKYAELWPL